MVKNIKKIFLIIILTFLLTNIFTSVNAGEYTIEPKPVSDSTDFTNMVGSIIGLIKWVAIAGAIIAISIIGIKYMMGSIEEKAQYKKSMVPWVVGIIIVAVSSTIVDAIYNTLI